MRPSHFFMGIYGFLPALAAIFFFCQQTSVYAQLAPLPAVQGENSSLATLSSPGPLPRLTLIGDAAPISKVVEIINKSLPHAYAVTALEMQAKPGHFTLQLSGAEAQQEAGSQESIIMCILNNLTNPAKPYEVRVRSNSPNILIGSAREATIDIGDITRFDKIDAANDSFRYAAINILIHELYEQYHLQVLSGVKPAKAKTKQLVRAHHYASQKEANYFNIGYTKIISKIYDEYLLVVFESKVNRAERVKYIVNHKFGNITGIERELVFLPRS